MKNIKNGLISSLFLLCFSSSIILSSNKEVKPASATVSKVGEVSLVGYEIYNPFAGNEFILLDLVGTDYPSTARNEIYANVEIYPDDPRPISFDFEFEENLYLYDLDNKRLNVDNFYQVYARPVSLEGQFTMSIWLTNAKGAKKGTLNKDFKIPSYAFLTGNTSSPTYGYYTLDRNYKVIAEDPTYTVVSETRKKWEVKEEDYDKTEATLLETYSYVDGDNEFLTFKIFGTDVDYPGSGGNYHLGLANIESQLPNFKSKIHLYDENNVELDYDYKSLSTINLWEIPGCYSIGIDVLRTAKKIRISEGLVLPSYARYLDSTSSPLFNGFTIKNELVLKVDQTMEHTTGARIPWRETVEIVGELTLKKVITNKPFENSNEFICLTFNEATDFASVGKVQWDSSKIALMSNLSTHYFLYDSSNNQLSNTVIHDAYYNFSCDKSEANTLVIMSDLSGLAVRAVVNKGLIFPSYSYFIGDKTSDTYGFYSLKIDYEITIEEGHGTHVRYESILWNLPECPIEYYDENNNLISSLSNSAVLGSKYYVEDVPPKDGYVGSWELVSPDDLEINNGIVIIPLEQQTIKFKAKYEIVPICQIIYLDEEGNALDNLTETAMGGTTYFVQPVISKKGHDGSWIVVSPSTVTISNNEIVLPYEEITVTLQAAYTPRTYTLLFEDPTLSPMSVVYGQPIGDLPEVAPVAGKNVVWSIGEEEINSETIYLYDVDMTATYEYVDVVCVVNFNSLGGSSIDSLTIVYGQKIAKLPTPTKEGYFFSFWATDEACEHQFNIDTPITSDMTLYAKWLEQCVVSFNSDGGSQVESVVVGKGQKLEQLLTPTRSGYTFLYWELDGQQFDINNPINGNTTLTAKWEKIPEETEEIEKKGCKSSIISASLIISLVSFIGVGLLIKKKEN